MWNRMSHANTELAISWLELIIAKLRAMASDEVESCCDPACTNTATLWEREPELRGFCREHAPTPHLVMSDEYSTRRW